MIEPTPSPAAPASRRSPVPWVLSLVTAAGFLLLLSHQGRIWSCAHDSAWRLWCPDAWSAHTSQHFLDPYSFTHMLHGFLFCALGYLVSRGRMPLPWLICLAVVGEGTWELVENSPAVIERYRTATAADYHGDAVLNSLGDIVCCAAGCWLAHRLRLWRALAVFLGVELVLLLWIKDSLLLNVVMLVRPLEAVKTWQGG